MSHGSSRPSGVNTSGGFLRPKFSRRFASAALGKGLGHCRYRDSNTCAPLRVGRSRLAQTCESRAFRKRKAREQTRNRRQDIACPKLWGLRPPRAFMGARPPLWLRVSRRSRALQAASSPLHEHDPLRPQRTRQVATLFAGRSQLSHRPKDHEVAASGVYTSTRARPRALRLRRRTHLV